ncbi:peptidoglycan recognition family protein [Streptomyces sp. NPDC021356]|uniref:peptidoglycan recognition protein family protein n=1 Tax=Streptomyces sp. NPDC021356 TaxID=3154900 RepID=UPI0033F8F71C
MATPLTADQMLAALRAEGLRLVEHPGWRTHNRGSRGDGWGPVHGVIIHHTGGTAPSDGQIVWEGRADLPGPDAHAYLAKDGTTTFTGCGRANHAGGGDGSVLQAVIDESYGARPPAPHKHEGSPGAVDGNARFYGLECSDRGTGTAWPAVQYDAAVRWAAAICRAHGWTEKSVIGHKEWSDWKPDPAAFDMADFRKDVAARLAHPASWTPGAPTNTPSKEDDMQAIDVWAYKGKTANGKQDPSDAYAYLRGTRAEVETLRKEVATLTALVQKLVTVKGA